MHFNVLNRKVHYWAAVVIALPLLVIAVTGSILQLKKHWTWVQPAERRGISTTPVIELSTIIAVLKSQPHLNVDGWHHVNRLDVRPDKGIVKVWLRSDWEVQIDLATAEILQVAYRRSDWIESIHDGSIFGDPVKLGLFFPAAVGLGLMWFGGMWMWLYPFLARRRVRRAKAAKSNLVSGINSAHTRN